MMILRRIAPRRTGNFVLASKDRRRTDGERGARFITINRDIIGQRQARGRTVRPKKITDYPAVPLPYLQVAEKLSSPFLNGPPICDELIAFVQHLFTEEEASLVRNLGRFSKMRATDLGKAERRPLEEAKQALAMAACRITKCLTRSVLPDDEVYAENAHHQLAGLEKKEGMVGMRKTPTLSNPLFPSGI